MSLEREIVFILQKKDLLSRNILKMIAFMRPCVISLYIVLLLCDFPLHQMHTRRLHSPPPPPPPALSTVSAISTSCQPSLQIYRPCILSQTNALLMSPRYSDTFSLRKLPLAAFYAFFNKACARHPPASLWPATSSLFKATSIFFVVPIDFS